MRDVRWALVEHIRTWLGRDGPIRQMIQSEGTLDGDTLRRIAKIYNVNRGISAKGRSEDASADGLAKLINRTRWANHLVERAKQCDEIARTAKIKGFTSKVQASAISKFSWFVRPAGWTMYDRYAANGLGTGARGMLKFYEELDTRRFQEVAEEIQMTLRALPIKGLHGTRVLDKLLMLKGADQSWAERRRHECRGFLTLLPNSLQRAIDVAADRIVRRTDIRRFLNG